MYFFILLKRKSRKLDNAAAYSLFRVHVSGGRVKGIGSDPRLNDSAATAAVTTAATRIDGHARTSTATAAAVLLSTYLLTVALLQILKRSIF